MSPLEFDLLKAFAEHPNRALSRERILNLNQQRTGIPSTAASTCASCGCARRSSPTPSIRGSSGPSATRATSSCRTASEASMNAMPAPANSCMRLRARPALALALALAGCMREPETALRIGTNVWIGSEPLYLARELGRLDAATVQLVEYPSASEVLRAFRNQAIDGMVISLDELFGLAADGFQPRIILVVDVSHGADVVVGRRGMRSMQRPQGQVGRRGKQRARRVRAEPGAGAQRHAGERRQRRAPRVERAAERVREGPGRRRRHVRSVSRAVPARRRHDAVRQHADSGRDRRPPGGARHAPRQAAEGDTGAARRLVRRARLHEARARGRGAPHGHPPADHRRAVPGGAEGPARPLARREPADAGRRSAGAGGHRAPAHGADAGGEAAGKEPAIEDVARAGAAGERCRSEPCAFRRRSSSRCRSSCWASPRR